MIATPAARNAMSRSKRRSTSLPEITAVGSSSIRTLTGANERPCNFDHLLIGDGQLLDPSAHVDLGAQPAKHIVRATLHQPVIDDAKPGERLIIDEHVLGDCEFREEHELLVNDVNACTLRLARAGPRNLIAVQLDFALVRNIGAGNDLDERALPGSIFANECMNLAGAD